MGSHQHSKNLDDGCGFDVSAFKVPRRGSLAEPSGTLAKNKKGRRRVENIGDGLLDGHDAQPAINVTAFSDQKVSRMRLASLGSAMPKSHRRLPTRNHHSFRPMRERRIIRGLDRRSPLRNALPPETARPVGGLSFRSRQRLNQCRLWNE